MLNFGWCASGSSQSQTVLGLSGTRRLQACENQDNQTPCDRLHTTLGVCRFRRVTKAMQTVADVSSGAKTAFLSLAASCTIFTHPILANIKPDGKKANECVYMACPSPNQNLLLTVPFPVLPELSCVSTKPFEQITSPTLASSNPSCNRATSGHDVLGPCREHCWLSLGCSPGLAEAPSDPYFGGYLGLLPRSLRGF